MIYPTWVCSIFLACHMHMYFPLTFHIFLPLSSLLHVVHPVFVILWGCPGTVHILYLGALLIHGCYLSFTVPIYPFLVCHLCERHIHRYFVHVVHDFFSVLVNRMPYFFPQNLILMCLTPFTAFYLLRSCVCVLMILIFCVACFCYDFLLSSKGSSW